MNYRHGYHAGNFADVFKHAVLLAWVRHLRQGPEPFTVIDTHAGGGLYDIKDADYARTGEAEDGIVRVMDMPEADGLQALAIYVRSRNPDSGDDIRYYPGSPLLICDHLRAEDDYVGYELRPDEASHLRHLLPRKRKVAIDDGYEGALEMLKTLSGPAFLLIDPPYERFDDYARTVDLLKESLALRPNISALVWVPLKDLETFDAFYCRLTEAIEGQVEALQLRLRPLDNPMKMNGCILILCRAPEAVASKARRIGKDCLNCFGDGGRLVIQS